VSSHNTEADDITSILAMNNKQNAVELGDNT